MPTVNNGGNPLTDPIEFLIDGSLKATRLHAWLHLPLREAQGCSSACKAREVTAI